MTTIWTTEKPVFTEECVLITADKVNDHWYYKAWQIEKLCDPQDRWYWGWLTGDDGEEYGDIADLKADLYTILPKLK